MVFVYTKLLTFSVKANILIYKPIHITIEKGRYKYDNF